MCLHGRNKGQLYFLVQTNNQILLLKAEFQIQYSGDIHIPIYMMKYVPDTYKLQDDFIQHLLSEFLQTDRMVAVLQYVHYNMESTYYKPALLCI